MTTANRRNAQEARTHEGEVQPHAGGRRAQKAPGTSPDSSRTLWARLAADERGQGTTEYAILVGVLVVIAIIAVVAFRGKIQELWTAIAEGVNSL